jgi:hypothetical protein
MCTKLVEVISGRHDHDLIIELLRYDWLRCGFRFLPPCLKIDSSKEQPEQTKSDLYQALPAEMEGVYRKNNRNQFFRKSYFLRISQEALLEIGCISNTSSPCLCILQDRETSLFAYNRFMIL